MLVAAIGVGLALVLVLADVLRPEAAGTPARAWQDGETHGRWSVVFTGWGEAGGHDDEVVLEPRAAADTADTHGGLVVTERTYLDPAFEVTVRTEEQIRLAEPNPWEVGWVLWNYENNDRFYAVALKPNGWEISKQDPAYPGKQRFLASGTDRSFPIGRDYRIRVEHAWPRMTVSVDGQVLGTIVDDERPYRGGAIGLYTEDAKVRFTDLDVLDPADD